MRYEMNQINSANKVIFQSPMGPYTNRMEQVKEKQRKKEKIQTQKNDS